VSEVAKESKSERIARRWGSLTSEVQAWVDIKIALAGVQIWERSTEELLDKGVPALVLVVALLFVLTGAALGLGALLGHPAWGFVIVGTILMVLSAWVYLYRNRLENGKQGARAERPGDAKSAEGENAAD